MNHTAPVLITGGAGFIGVHTVRQFRRHGVPVRVVDNERTGSLENLRRSFPDDPGLTWTRGDIRDAQLMRELASGCQAIVHLAAQVSVVESMEMPEETLEINVMGTARVLDAARTAHVPRVVFASSCAIYGENLEVPFAEETPPRPMSVYGLSKWMGEELAQFYTHQFGVDAVVLRFFNVFGPGQRADSPYASVIPNFMKAVLCGEPMTIFGTGEQTRDFVFVEDVAAVVYEAALRERVEPKLFNVARGLPVSIKELAQRVRHITGRDVPIQFAPPRPGEMLHAHARIDRLSRDLGWSPDRFVSLEEGLRNTWEWFRREHTSAVQDSG